MKRRRFRLVIIILAVFCALIILSVFTHKMVLYAVKDFLIAEDSPKPSDIIIVLSGSDMEERVVHGFKLYQDGYAAKIIMSGGPRYWNTTAAADMRRHAIFLGVPSDSILLEKQSKTTYENAQYCLHLMEDHDFKSAIVVTSTFHTKRTKIIFEKFFEEKGNTFTICAFDDSFSRPVEWWKDEITTRNIVNEYLKLLWHYLFTN